MSVRLRSLALALVFALALPIAGCGASGIPGKPQVSSEFGVREAQLFEDGVDLIEDPKGLEGQWRNDWENDLNERIAASDMIATGVATTLRTDTDLEKRTSYHVVFAVDRVFKGEKPGSELSLASGAGAGGYGSIERDRQHMLNRNLVVFVKYAESPSGKIIAHFHLSPPSDVVLARIREFETRRQPNRVIVVEHKQ